MRFVLTHLITFFFAAFLAEMGFAVDMPQTWAILLVYGALLAAHDFALSPAKGL